MVAICAFILWRRSDLDMSDDVVMHTVVVLVVAAIHAVYIAFVVTREGVKEAARRYGRELILSCQTLMTGKPPAAAKTESQKEPINQKACRTGGLFCCIVSWCVSCTMRYDLKAWLLT